jgi:site-specific DNA recombinase
LLADIDSGLIDQIVVYKIDRLTRSLPDFARIVDRFDAAGSSFVSVTQSFNTATSMGRLTLNMLLSFAQFEREVTAERIRDKIAASKRKGLWMGGLVPLGYDADGRTLKINQKEAPVIRKIYDLYLAHGSIPAVKQEAERQRLLSKKRRDKTGRQTGGKPFKRGQLYHLLTNPLYAGKIRHRKTIYDGQHPAIIDPDTWEAVQQKLMEGASRHRNRHAHCENRSLLVGRIFDETGDRLTPSHSFKRTADGAKRRFRYYISNRLIVGGDSKDPSAWRLPAQPLEEMVADLIRKHLTRPEFMAKLLPTMSIADEIALRSKLKTFLGTDPNVCNGPKHSKPDKADEPEKKQSKITGIQSALSLVEKIDLIQGKIAILLDRTKLADLASSNPDQISDGALQISSPFQDRKRGVETRLIIEEKPIKPDTVLIRNIARAMLWYEEIKGSKTTIQIARENNTSKHRVQQSIDRAFIAPDIVKAILEGTQPMGFTSDWLMRNPLPSDWQDQRKRIANL